MNIRPATESDYKQISQLIRSELQSPHAKELPKLFKDTEHILPEDYFLQYIESENSEIFVIEEESLIIGVASIEVKNTPNLEMLVPRKFAYISDFAIDKSQRKRGLGEKLFNKCKDWAISKGASAIELYVWEFNQGAINFYQRMGFKTFNRKMGIDL